MNQYDDIARIINSNAHAKGGVEWRVVFTNGCFDILHPGHLDVIRRCRELAGPRGTVVVAVNSDESVRRLKGPARPIFSEDARCELVSSLAGVDYAVTFDEDTPRELLEALRPKVIVKGGDYEASKVVGADLAVVVIVPTREGYSTTGVVGKFCDECEAKHG